MKIFKFAMSIALPVVAGLIVTPKDAAADNIVVNGAVCNNTGTSADPDVHYDSNGVFNNNVSTQFGRHFVCPIHRPDAGELTDMTNIFARVVDGRTDAVVSCWAISCDSFGTSCVSGTSATTTSAGTGNSSLSLGSVDVFSYGHATVFCALPGKATSTSTASRIISVRYTD